MNSFYIREVILISKKMIIKMLGGLLLALFVSACNDNNGSSKKEEMASISPAGPLSPQPGSETSEYALPSPSNGFIEIYHRSESVDINGDSRIYSFKDNVYYLPPPGNQEQKQYCKDSFKSKLGGTYCKFIETSKDGEIEVFGTQLVDLRNGEIGLFINEKLYKNFVDDCRTLIAKDKGSYALSYSIQMKNVPVKGGDKITFKETKYPGGVIGQLAINFKGK